MNYYSLVQKNFLTVWILILLTMALVLILTLTGCEKQGTDVISASEIPKETPKANVSENITTANASKNVSSLPSSDASSNKDLKLKSIMASTVYPKQYEDFEISFTVENPGKEKIDKFEYSLKITKQGVSGETLAKSSFEESTEAIPAGGKIKIRKEYSLSDLGAYSIEIKLDPDNKIKEKDEANNKAVADITVIKPTGSTANNSDNEGPAPKPSGTCVDTDGGKVYTKKGKCTDQGMYIAGFNDFCTSDTKIIELYCKEGECVQEEHSCVCEEGACSS